MARPVENLAGDWHKAASVQKLSEKKVLTVRIRERQIALFQTHEGIRACNNNCPHEGYPLAEGDLGQNCILTCNWHNWKFDLNTGENLFGGDRLRTYPLEIRGDEIWINMQDAPLEEQRSRVFESLQDAFDDYSYDRIGRELARLSRLNTPVAEIMAAVVDWSFSRMEFGWTHAYAGMADWLQLYDEYEGDEEVRLLSLTEIVAHTAYDVLREPVYPFTENIAVYDEFLLLNAIEDEDEARAIELIRGAFDAGLDYSDLEPALSQAALAHYNDFGHSLIYVVKGGWLINRLGSAVALPLTLGLVRALVYATREERIPEFRDYASILESWQEGGSETPNSSEWVGLGIKKSMQRTLASAKSKTEDLFQALLLANARNLLSFDIRQHDKHHVTVSGNVGWLDFTHGITFANAVRTQCEKYPELWPSGLLQMACFHGRNTAFTESDQKVEDWVSGTTADELTNLFDIVIDHGQAEHIVSVHLLKTAMAAREELAMLGQDEQLQLLAAVKRFMVSPLKRRYLRRTAWQSLQFVARE